VISPTHTVAVALVLNRIIERNDGRVTYAHLRIVVDHLQDLLEADLEPLVRALREGGTVRLGLDGGELALEVEDDRVTVRECPYRGECRRLSGVADGPLVLPCTVLVQLALDELGEGRHVVGLERGDAECSLRLVEGPANR